MEEMLAFFRDTHGLPFTGWLHRWNPETLKACVAPKQPNNAEASA
ncbi:MAG: hypothetical protein ABW189_01570 [Rickettsiales bacterium]